MDQERKIRLLEKGETDLYLFSLLKELELKMYILEKRVSLIEDNITESKEDECPYQ